MVLALLSGSRRGDLSVLRRFTVRQRVSAAPGRVWEAWTTPEHLAEHFLPTGALATVDSFHLDLREGGAFAASFADEHGTEYRCTMTLTTVRTGEQLSYRWSAEGGSSAGEVTVTLSRVGDDTLVQYDFTGEASKADLLVVRAVAASSLERLAEIVRTIA